MIPHTPHSNDKDIWYGAHAVRNAIDFEDKLEVSNLRAEHIIS